jgi:radical SAM protein with 4Fe4S-binding SPASM domain
MLGIRAVQQERRRRRRAKPIIFIAGTVNAVNAARFDEVFEVAEEVEADGVTACYGWFQTEASCRAHEALMAERLGTIPRSARGWLWDHEAIDTAALTRAVRRIRERRWSFSYVFIPALDEADIPRYYDDHSQTFGYQRCLVPWSIVQVLPNGDVTTCGDYPDYLVGNVRDASLLELWNNDRYRRFRQLLATGLLPVCSRCCGLLAE